MTPVSVDPSQTTSKPASVDPDSPSLEECLNSNLDLWELNGEYYQVLAHAWDHEVKDFKVVYRPLYHCTAKAGRFEAHYMAVSHFSRWESKFRKLTNEEIRGEWAEEEGESVESTKERPRITKDTQRRILLTGSWRDPDWTHPDRTGVTAEGEFRKVEYEEGTEAIKNASGFGGRSHEFGTGSGG